jgi:hypothetical protein
MLCICGLEIGDSLKVMVEVGKADILEVSNMYLAVGGYALQALTSIRQFVSSPAGNPFIGAVEEIPAPNIDAPSWFAKAPIVPEGLVAAIILLSVVEAFCKDRLLFDLRRPQALQSERGPAGPCRRTGVLLRPQSLQFHDASKKRRRAFFGLVVVAPGGLAEELALRVPVSRDGGSACVGMTCPGGAVQSPKIRSFNWSLCDKLWSESSPCWCCCSELDGGPTAAARGKAEMSDEKLLVCAKDIARSVLLTIPHVY